MFFRKKKEQSFTAIRALEERENIRIIRLQGNIDMTTMAQIRLFREKLTQNEGFHSKHVLLDFKKVSHTDTAAVAGIIQALSELQETNHRLGAVNAPKAFSGIIQILKVDNIIKLYASEAEAVKDLTRE